MLESEPCEFCAQGIVVKRNEAMAFHQQTDRGSVFCTVTIAVGVCDQCGMKTWDEAAEAIIEAAVQQEYEKLK